jgi:DNA primase
LGRIPEATIQEIRDRADIVGLIGRYVELKQAGRNWVGLCPFHDEKTPSFNVNPDRQIFHCFGCDKGGNVFRFLMEHEGRTFPEAVRTLADELGIVVPESSSRDRGDTELVFSALKFAQESYREALRSSEAHGARAYLERRGIDDSVAEHFGLGFAPDRWDHVVKALDAAGVSDRHGGMAGILSERSSGGYYDLLRGRITFPICDVRGRVIAFGGRALTEDQQPKYLNSPESPAYHKRSALYGFPQALEPIRRAGRAIVCEGYFDAIALQRAGLGEAVATCGTALTTDHATHLKRTKQVVLLFDGDAAGQKAMERALAVLLPAGLRVRAATLPDGQDPDDYLAESGADALRQVVDRAPDALELVIRHAMATGCVTPADKADAVGHVAPLVALVADPVERSEYARRLSVATGTDPQAVEAVVRGSARGQTRSPSSEVAAEIVAPRRSSPEDRHLRHIALILCRHPGLVSPGLAAKMQEVLPAGPWKGLVFALIEAGQDGCLDETGAIDLNGMEGRLPPGELSLLHEMAVDESLLESETPASEMLAHLIARYLAKTLEAKEKEIRRRMQDPTEDPQVLLRERQALLDRRRAAVGIEMGSAP